MKIAIIEKDTLRIASMYDAASPNQAAYGGPWGDAERTAHIVIPAEMDIRAVSAEMDGDSIILIEDEELKQQLAESDALEAVQKVVANATAFGQKLMNKFAAQNVILGITQDGKTGEVLDKMAPVMAALQSGSLYEAVERAKAITPDQYDEKYVTHARIYAFINELEAYLGLPLSL